MRSGLRTAVKTVPTPEAGTASPQPAPPPPSTQPALPTHQPLFLRTAPSPADIRRPTQLRNNTTHLRPSPVASAGTSRGVPALHATHNARPAREAGRKEEN